MWLDNASQDLVDYFWRQSGGPEPFPRNLERPLALALPVALIKLPRLRLLDIEHWLKRRGVGYEFGCQSRTVRGCLVAYRGQGLIFIDGSDPDNERRFTLAHEIAHFLVDYWLPRSNAIEKFGDKITEVIDGFRSPTIDERVLALLGNQAIKVHTNLMERDRELEGEAETVWQVEDRADRIALGLLAPADEVLAGFDPSTSNFPQRLTGLKEVLCNTFGLPSAVAEAYAHGLLRAIGQGPSWLETLGLR